ncbi:MAG TPA: class I SAM-dependent methyltransferase [Blastocatellia bacterium]|nr:class I SAM-dependent methyltransferase [Blastocatellia bacterium]
MTPPSSQPSPVLFFETVNAHQKSAAIKGAIELDLFTAIAEGKTDAKSIAEARSASERGVRILCDYLVVIGFLTKEGDNYSLTPDSAAFLNRHSPAYVGGAIGFLLSPTIMEAFKDVAAVVRKGGTVLSEEGSTEPEHPMWVDFARAMGPLNTLSAQSIARLVSDGANKHMKVLDIAAGHGMFGISIAKHNPEAEIIALDWPSVLNVARENAKTAGVEERYSTLPGSAFDVNFGRGYDLILLTNFLHHFDVKTNEKLLSKVHAALADGGRAVTLEFVPNEDRVSPPPAAGFSLVMLASTPHGDAYTFSEFEKMFANAGFSRSELHQLPPTPQQVVISYK